jgi:hypothetical protein
MITGPITGIAEGMAKDARRAYCQLLDLRRRYGHGCRRFGAFTWPVRAEERLGGFAGFIDLFSIVMSVRRLRIVRQGVSPDVFGD